jgi:murein DD-endopeptidase MepM/ murein hydrolase activator NlpD
MTRMKAGAMLLVAVAISLPTVAQAQGAYRYKNSEGNWVFTDRKPNGDAKAEEMTLKTEPVPPRILVERVQTGERIVLKAINECECTVQFGLRLQNVRHLSADGDGLLQAVVPPRSEKAIVSLSPTGTGAPSYDAMWNYIVGKPGAEHRPSQPYRLPFAAGQSFRVSQAFPDAFTHVGEAKYAVDLALPDQTAVYAARGGRVINVAHEHFRGGVQASMMDEANFVQILHDDDTVAMYAHLHWDSIRVRAGQVVRAGEYIANSGNTGFSTGPHLHFAVYRNIGMKSETVPVVFAGLGDAAIVPRTGAMLKAH